MKSTGEVMGIAKRFGQAYAKAQLGAGGNIVKRRRAFISVRDADKARVGEIAKRLIVLGFEVLATRGTAAVLQAADSFIRCMSFAVKISSKVPIVSDSLLSAIKKCCMSSIRFLHEIASIFLEIWFKKYVMHTLLMIARRKIFSGVN